MSEEKITPEEIRSVMNESDPVLAALSVVLKELASETVATLAGILSFTGATPGQLPGEFLLQAVLVESDKVFKPISRDTWVSLYDTYHAVQDVLDANPDLKAEITGKHNRSIDKLLEGNF